MRCQSLAATFIFNTRKSSVGGILSSETQIGVLKGQQDFLHKGSDYDPAVAQRIAHLFSGSDLILHQCSQLTLLI